ncbi:coiled-coil domain-containing protein 89 isoform X1 [Oryzias latipes]|uniref:coiled-coil domain-containing protein 89 isoform X1 n=2 Tax=Oryzias latipes TaxID=8090 RepID=UPI0009DB515C|nr:coiled-coil domain-containing protein 89 isoform X1 [Oryzias latipes]
MPLPHTDAVRWINPSGWNLHNAMQENVDDPKDKRSTMELQKDSILKSFKNPLTFAIDDLEEKKMLRSRIEEQSKLILLLKHRADETLLRYLAMQNINSELNDQVAQMQNELISKTEHIEALEIRCNDLAIDKNAMEFQKKQSVQLMRENQQLRKELATCELKLQEQAAQLKSREEFLLGQLCDAQQRHTDAVKMCEDFEQKLEEVGKQHAVMESNKKESTSNVKKGKNKLLKMKKSKIIQEKEEEIRQLEVKWKEEKKGRIEAQKRFELEAEAAVNTDLRVKSLQSDLEESKAKFKKLSMDFKALTEHSTNLLEQERNLNKRLRDAIGQI